MGTTQNPFLGSVPQKPLPGNYPLKLRDAIDRGLKFNLGLLLSGEGERQARGARLNTLSELLPNVTTRTTETVEQVNLAISNVAKATRETETSLSQTLQTATQLTGLSRELTRLIQPTASA